MTELPKEIVYNNRKYILEIKRGEGHFESDVFCSYFPETEIVGGDNLPLHVHNKEEWYYLCTWGVGYLDEPEKTAREEMMERLQGARAYYPEIDQTLKNL